MLVLGVDEAVVERRAEFVYRPDPLPDTIAPTIMTLCQILEEHGGGIELNDASARVPGQRGAWIRLRFSAETVPAIWLLA